MTREEYDALPLGSVLSSTSACPSCGQRGKVDITIVLVAAPLGTFSLSGTGMKVPARKGAQFTCGGCGATGSAGPK